MTEKNLSPKKKRRKKKKKNEKNKKQRKMKMTKREPETLHIIYIGIKKKKQREKRKKGRKENRKPYLFFLLGIDKPSDFFLVKLF